MFFPHCLFVILLFVTSTIGVALFRDIYKREAAEESSEKCGKAEAFYATKQDVKSFTSPAFPNSYPAKTDCTWRISTQLGNQIVVNILSIDVEYEMKCQYDYLVLHDGPDSSYPQVGQYCGKTPPAAFTSTLSEVFVAFHSDAEESLKGFEIGYYAIGDFDDVVVSGGMNDDDGEGVTEGPKSYGGSDHYGDVSDEDTDSQTVEKDGCNEIWHNARHGNITSPGYPDQYPSNADCTIEINAPINTRIDLTFNFFELEEICVFDYVIIKDSSFEGAEPIGKYCGHDDPGLIQSSTGQLIIKFISDVSDQRGGFFATFTTHVLDNVGTQEDLGVKKYGCNEIWHNARHGNITSPGYPDQYPSNADCTIEINAPINTRIDLTFNFFELEEICIFDYIIIKDSSSEDAEPIGKYCGHDDPGLIQSSTGQLVIKFISDVADQWGGFFATFSTHGSSSTHPSPGGTNSYGYNLANGDVTLEFTIEPMDSLDLRQGDLVRKECEVNKEEGVISWYMGENLLPEGEETDGILINDDGRTLLIPSMETEHEGYFTCTAHLPGGPPIHATFSLQFTGESSIILWSPDYISSFLDPDLVQFETVPITANITVETSHIFLCSTTQNFHLDWEKDGQPLNYNTRIYKIFEANLIVSDARMEDSGKYSCIASNKMDYTKLGEASANLTVTSILEVSDVCGIVSAQEVTEDESTEEDKLRIVNGKKALKGSSPWMARLWYRAPMQHFCGGSLINSRWVVTAAHCFNKISRPEQLEVRLGDHDTLDIEPEEMTFRVSQFIKHPNFNRITFDSDIALIELDGRVPLFTDYIKPICLPNVRTSEKLLEPGEITRIAGWGQIIEDGAYPRFLRELNIPIVQESTCKESTDDDVTDSMFCAGFSQASQGDACQGDTGGPLAQQKDGKWYLTGIISWGEGCAREGKYGFYTKVVQFNDWLAETINNP